MNPLLLAMIGVQVVSGITQFINSEKSRNASAKELERMTALLDKIQSPDQKWDNLTPEEFHVIQQFSPQTASFIQEKAPQLVRRSAEGEQAFNAQIEALRRFRNMGEGPDLESQIAQQQALKNAAIQNQGMQESITQNMQRRGLGNSGFEFQKALAAQQNAGQIGAQTSQNAALDAYRNKLNSLRNSADIAGNIGNQEMMMQGKNADIINSANQRAANRQQEYQHYLAGSSNQAQLHNMGMNQNAQDLNTSNRNKYQEMNQRNSLEGEQRNYQNALDKLRIQSGQSHQRMEHQLQGTRDQNQAIQGTAEGINAGLEYSGRPRRRKEDEYGHA